MEIAEFRRAILSLQVDIRAFEERYQMSSDEFYGRFGEGAKSDSEDFIIWAGLHEMLRENQRVLEELGQ